MKRALVVLLGLLSVAGCFGGSPEEPEYIPPFPGLPDISVYTGPDDCKDVLAVGDSLMYETQAHLQAALADSGRCANVRQAAWGGTGPSGVGGGFNWHEQLQWLLINDAPDIVVMEFVGNSAVTAYPYGSQAWADDQKMATLALISLAQSYGAEVYVMAAPSAAFYCDFATYGPPWDDYRAWVRGISNVGHGDWSQYLSPGDVYARRLSFSGEPLAVRTTDCTHLTTFGSQIAAYVTAAAIQEQWV